jgi:hypothetical protein
MSTEIMRININEVKKKINQSISDKQSESPSSVSSSPSPTPLTPNTQDYCSKHLCYAPKIKKKKIKISDKFRSFKLD